jgi:hypothetical protein
MTTSVEVEKQIVLPPADGKLTIDVHGDLARVPDDRPSKCPVKRSQRQHE